MGRNISSAQRWQIIEEEYGEAPREVVWDMYYNMRLPFKHIAAVLEISEPTLRKWFKLWKFEIRTTGYIRVELPGKVTRRAWELGYNSVKQAISDLRMSGKTWQQTAEVLQCTTKSLSNHFPPELKGHYNLTEAGRDAMRESMRRLQAAGLNAKFPPIGLKTPGRPYDTCSRL